MKLIKVKFFSDFVPEYNNSKRLYTGTMIIDLDHIKSSCLEYKWVCAYIPQKGLSPFILSQYRITFFEENEEVFNFSNFQNSFLEMNTKQKALSVFGREIINILSKRSLNSLEEEKENENKEYASQIDMHINHINYRREFYEVDQSFINALSLPVGLLQD